MDTTITMYVLVALIGALISYLGLKLAKEKKLEKDAIVLATIITKLDNVIDMVKSIQAEIGDQKKWNSGIIERLTKVEESVKQAHKRISEIEGSG